MEKLTVNFTEEQAYDAAFHYFVQTSGLTGKKEKHERMMKDAMAVRRNGVNGIDIKAEILYCQSDVYGNGKIRTPDMELTCPVFDHIDDDKVKGVYFYIITSGECYANEENIMELLYADIWGTSYVDAGRDLLQRYLEEDLKHRLAAEDKYGLSVSFGPGFYGMDMDAARGIYNLFENKPIGVDLREAGIMVPLKSCIGLYMAVEKGVWMPGKECRDCIGNVQGCNFCRIKNNRAV